MDIGCSMVLGIIIAVPFTIAWAASGMNPGQIEHQLTNSAPYNIISLVTGLFFSMLGGYVAANIAAGAEMKHALATGLASTLLYLLFMLLMPNSAPAWYHAVSLLLIAPMALIGGYWRLKKPRRPPPAAPPSSSPPIPLP